jgi:hypothetical protein
MSVRSSDTLNTPALTLPRVRRICSIASTGRLPRRWRSAAAVAGPAVA